MVESLIGTANSSHSAYAAHDHSPTYERPLEDLAPGALSGNFPGPLDALPVDKQNDFFHTEKQARFNRLEAESKGFDSIFAQ